MINKWFKKFWSVFYDHWKIIFAYSLPSIGFILLSFWDKFREIMMIPIPFWILFIFLLLLGFLIVVIIVLLSKNKKILDESKTSLKKTVLINNLIYKKDNPIEAFCPACFERDGELKRMRRYFNKQEEEYFYSCFVCDHTETVSIASEKNPNKEDLKISF
ncbi:MAG: hypothetical protein PHR47_02220 [Candidatus Pacebacteria bacterium]|nr:hypothetical protein [Candidatus Paceibacterota bacterium]